ncbi:MAG: D-alanyl-D-alanine carboxypeptidase family protein [Oscillatoriaceae cyanobacterium]
MKRDYLILAAATVIFMMFLGWWRFSHEGWYRTDSNLGQRPNTPTQPLDFSGDQQNFPKHVPSPPVSSSGENLNKPFLGHFPYKEADANNLIIVASYAMGEYQRFEELDAEAAKALMKLIYAARDEGVWIIPVSAFRSIERQKLLFDNQVERRGSVEEAAKISAPPGYSEHHTGLALDLADGKFPKLDIKEEFENTEAFRWLQLHGKEYGFEMSFPALNPQGVIYEPWHWRFVGSPHAEAIFALARKSG